MKKWLSILLLTALLLGVLCVSSVFAETQTGSCGENITWSLDQNGVLTISGTGPMTNYQWGQSPFYGNSDIQSVIIEENVTSVGDYAFVNSYGISSVSLPDSVTMIGSSIFINLFPLEEITLPKNLTTIQYDSFGNCISVFKVDEDNSSFSAVDGVLF